MAKPSRIKVTKAGTKIATITMDEGSAIALGGLFC